MAADLLTAFALLLILEGLVPSISPKAWRKTMREVTKLNDRNIRWVGVVSMLIGAIILKFAT